MTKGVALVSRSQKRGAVTRHQRLRLNSSPSERGLFGICDPARLCQLHQSPGPATPAATFRGDANSFALVLYGRLSLDHVARAGRVVVTGDPALASAFSGWCRGI